MHFEVEQKFRVVGFYEVEQQLRSLSAEITSANHQIDHYFAHPARDFAITDEALRVRVDGQENRVTYKGPRIDLITKTRQELELSLLGGAEYRDQFVKLLELLGFRLVAAVHKNRRKAFVDWKGNRIEVSLDDVRDVGTFVELELIAEEKELDHARRQLQSLADHLGLQDSERRSYLNLLLERE